MELYDVLDANEIDGQGKDVDIIAEEGDATWTKVLIHPAQEVPAGNYDFAISLQATVSSTNNSVVYRIVGDASMDEVELHIDRERPTTREVYFFNLSWEGGPFAMDIEMARSGTSFSANCDFAEFSLRRRS